MNRSIWDYPATDTELDGFYGRFMSEQEIETIIGECATLFDSGELADVSAIVFEQVADAIADKDASKVGEIIMKARRQRIADLASKAIYGRVGVIKENEVKV